MELIGVQVGTPWKKSDKAWAKQYFCNVDDCSLRAQNQCINTLVFRWCKYGKVTKVTGWTKRARKYGQFMREWKEKREQYPIINPEERITFIGDYVWLPYSHMNMVDGEKQGIPFEAYSGFFQSGEPAFMRQDLFTPEMVVRLVEFRPQAVFGGTITSYVTEALPRFLADLREVAPSIYHQARQLKPEIVDITAKAEHKPVSLGWLKSIGWSGKATINDLPVFVYSSGEVKFELESSKDFPDAIGGAEVNVTLPPKMEVYLDPTHYKFVAMMNKARKDGEIT